MSRIILVPLLLLHLTGDLIGGAARLCAHLQCPSDGKPCGWKARNAKSVKLRMDGPQVCTHPNSLRCSKNVKTRSSGCCLASAPIQIPPAEVPTEFAGGREELQVGSPSAILRTNFFGHFAGPAESGELLFTFNFNGSLISFLSSQFRI
jgi:hypothetical protein